MRESGLFAQIAVVALAAIASSPVSAERPRIDAVRATTPPKIDGRLDDPVWRTTPRAGNLLQAFPNEGAEPTQRTEFAVAYDRRALYVAVWCYDTEPAAIVATEMARDGRTTRNDYVAIVLDTFLDRRNGYIFRVNPNGARDDALISAHPIPNDDWDAVWHAHATIDERGWYAEVAIPHTSIAFAADSTVWGFNLSRGIKRRDEIVRWSGAQVRYRDHDVSEAGDLGGLEGLEQGIGLEIRPYGAARYRDDRVDDDVDRLFDAGVDARYSITPNLTASLSYNTDFAETEVDARQINLTRFPLFFPEKREFFLQDASIFEFGDVRGALIPFFSRRIGLSASGEPVPITIAGKLTGRVGEYNVGVIDALVDSHDGLPARNAFVGRVSRNVLENSTLGVLVTAGDPNSRNDNLFAGTDFNFRNTTLIDDWTLGGNAFLSGTWTEGVAGSDNLAFSGVALAEHEKLVTYVKYYQLDENFYPALGFAPRRGIRAYELEATSRFFTPDSDWLRRIFVSYFQQHVTDLDDELETALYSLTPILLLLESSDEIFFNTQTRFDEPRADFEIHPGVTIPPDEYWWQRYRFGFASATKRPVELDAAYEIGTFYDGYRDRWVANLTLDPSRHFSVSTGYELNKIRLPEGNFDTRLASVRLQINFTTELIWYNLVQYDDVSDRIGVNSRLRWEFVPGSDLFVVLTQEVDRNEGRPRVDQTEIAVKVGATIRF